ncbi:MAG: hypothetical protein HC836_48675 [Richelia sp. RM2_1_2]|nr:hypothetical protein [Richelia sp. RM2_1_2]
MTSYNAKLTRLLVDLPKKVIGGITLPVVPDSLVSKLSINPDAGVASVFDIETNPASPGTSLFVDEPEVSVNTSSGNSRKSWPTRKTTGTEQLTKFGGQLSRPANFTKSFVSSFSSGSSTGAGSAGRPAGSSRHAKIAYDYFISQGYTPNGASGIVGNLQQESGSGINPTLPGDNGSAYGIAQWRGERRSGLEAFANANGKLVSDFSIQLAYLDQELRGNIATGSSRQFGKSNLFGRVNGSSSPESSALLFGKEFERPKVVEQVRATNAREVLRLYGPGATTPLTPAPTQSVGNVTLPNGVDYSLKLSKFLTLGDLTVNSWASYHLTPQVGYTVEQLATNLKGLAVNVLDPVISQFGPPGTGKFTINSGFRRYPGGKVSQHNRGQAADLQWAGRSAEFHLGVAQWIYANLSFDQLLLEKGNSYWVHVSFTNEKTLRRSIGSTANASSDSAWRWGVLAV